MSKKRVYLLQNTNEYNAELAKKLTAEDFEIVGQNVDGCKGLEEIKDKNPDFVIMELVLSGCDGITVIENVKRLGLQTKFIVVSALNSDGAVAAAINAGAIFFFAKPCEFSAIKDVLCGRVFSAPNQTQDAINGVVPNKTTVDEKISKIFISVGIPPHIKGYCFLREGVKMAINEPSIINNITKKLYPMIGEKYQTSASKVERAIRHAIEVAWNRGRIDSINNILGVRAYVGQEKPTNGEFIALIADKMLLEMA